VRLEIQADRGNDRLTLRRLLAAAPTSLRIDVELAGLTIDRALELAGDVRVVLAAAHGLAHTLRPYLDRVAVASFDERLLEELRRFRDVESTLLFSRPLRVATAARTIGPSHDLVTRDLIDAAHALGLRVVPWTVNDVRRMAELMNSASTASSRTSRRLRGQSPARGSVRQRRLRPRLRHALERVRREARVGGATLREKQLWRRSRAPRVPRRRR
jgi:hypothetical protein